MKAIAETRRVLVGGWQNPRTVILEGDKVSFKVALSHDHCPTCASRIRHVTDALARKNVQHSWAYQAGVSGSYVTVSAPGEGIPVEKYLSQLLDLNIH